MIFLSIYSYKQAFYPFKLHSPECDKLREKHLKKEGISEIILAHFNTDIISLKVCFQQQQKSNTI